MKDGGMKSTSEKLSTGFSYFCLDSRFAVSGQPSFEDLPALKEKGFARVVNVRGFQEMEKADFDVPKAMERNQLAYHNIPIIKDSALDWGAMDKVHQILSSAEKSGEKTIIHCASGQRAVIALLGHLLEAEALPLDLVSSLAFDLGLRNEALLIKFFQGLEALKSER